MPVLYQRDVFPTYREYTKKLTQQYMYIRSLYNDKYVDELCKQRGYIGEDQRRLIEEIGIGYCNIDNSEELGEDRLYLGLVSEREDNFLLNNRFIVPINDIAGNLVALVGWYPDYKKYITTPTLFFSKESLFFNIDHAYRLSWEQYNGTVFLVEGIFDALSLRAIGLPAIATMGITVQEPKSELLKLFRKVVAIPDNDKAGKRAVQRGTKYSWIVPENTTFLRIKGRLITEYGSLKVKDVDNLVTYFEKEDVRNILLTIAESKELIEVLKLG